MLLSISLKTEQIEHCPNYPLLAFSRAIHGLCMRGPGGVGYTWRGGGVPDLLFKTSYLLNLHSKTINPNPWGGGGYL